MRWSLANELLEQGKLPASTHVLSSENKGRTREGDFRRGNKRY
jgi:hypothetical protein